MMSCTCNGRACVMVEGLRGCLAGPFVVVLDSSVWRALDTLRGRDSVLFFPSLAVAAWQWQHGQSM